MSKSDENLVAIILEPVELGVDFIEWPLHITLVPWFHGYDDAKLEGVLRDLAASHKSFSVTVGPVEKFGYKKDVEVNVIDDSNELKDLHQAVLNALEANEFIIHQRDIIGSGFRAHITRQPHGAFEQGRRVNIKSFALIKQERLKTTGDVIKKVIKEYSLT